MWSHVDVDPVLGNTLMIFLSMISDGKSHRSQVISDSLTNYPCKNKSCDLLWRIKHRGGCQRLFLMSVETMEFDIFIITQIVYVIVTLKLIISSFSSAYIAYVSIHASFKC